jgi:diguanylate cyclase (GGDEF)-like protein
VGDERDYRATLVTTTGAGTPPPAARSDPGSACLVVIYGQEIGRRIELSAGATLDAGRSLQTDLPLDDDAVSRRHARVAWTNGAFFVADLGSTNGTYVNDQPVKEHRLIDGDQIKIGRSIFKFLSGSNVELAYHDEIYRLMTYDGLTQVHNKRAFETSLEREVSRARRYERALSLVMFDLDHFKRINDTRGHLAGDALLRLVASLVVENVRREDLVARVGGEEFALLLPEIALAQAQRVAEKVRAAVAQGRFLFEDMPMRVTASFGVASLNEAADSAPLELYRIADERLFEAKSRGRDRVR